MEIIYQDTDIVAINKPEGLLVHRSELDKNENIFAVQSLRDAIEAHVFPIHRLDKPTSGVLLFSKSSEMASVLNQQFQEHTIVKKYMAMVRGFTDESGHITKPLRKIIDKYGEPIRKSDEEQECETFYKTLSTIELPISIDKYPTSRYSLLELTPVTGRRHQLRRHMKHISHPIIGDPKYGKSNHNNYIAEVYGTNRLMLCSTMLSFHHPRSGKKITLTAKPTESFSKIFTLFDFNYDNFEKDLLCNF